MPISGTAARYLQKLSHFQLRLRHELNVVVDIDDFVDNFDFIMLIKCYGLKCSTGRFSSCLLLPLAASCGVWCHMGSAYVSSVCAS